MTWGAGRYYDGERAARREVAVQTAPGGLRIVAPADRSEIAFWRYAELRPVDDIRRDGGPRRIRAARGGARLVLADRALLAEIEAQAPRLAAHGRGRAGLVLRWAGLLAVSVAVLLGVLWFGLPRFADGAARLVPDEWEAAFGDRLVEPVVRNLARFDPVETAAFCTGPRGRAVLEALARRLASGVGESPPRLRVQVVNLEMNNAFALPGGRILIAEGLLRAARSPDEVAGVLAHEIGHVIHRHTTAAMFEALGLAFLFGVLLGDFGTGAAAWAGEVLIGLRFRREAEAEADERALELLARAGVSSRGLADFFARLEKEAGGAPAFLHPLSTHPSTESRRRRAARETAAHPPSLGAADWRTLREICRVREPLDPQ